MLSTDISNTTSQLTEIVGPSNVLTDAASLDNYGRDWTKHFTPNPRAIVFPRTTEQVRDLVLWARKNKISLVPSGGRTGLSAAAYAINKEVVVSFEKMNKILELDTLDQTVRCEAGVVTEQLQKYVWENGYYFPVDFASRGSSQIGGNVATNAGGIKVIRYGLIRNWITSLKVVTGTGEILELNRSLVKNATGYDLRQLFIGSEGTLGFITEITLAVTTKPHDLTVMVLGSNELSSIMKIYTAFRGQVAMTAYEMFTEIALQKVIAQGRVGRPFESTAPYYVLVEFENNTSDALDKAMAIFEKCAEDGLVTDGVVSQSPQQLQDLWALREDISEATSGDKPYKNDISVRVSKVPQFLEEMSAILQKEHPDFEVVWFGHIGDGNLHINILKPKALSSDEFVQRCKSVDKVMFQMIEKLGGSISAEHGVGLVKKPFLHHTRSTHEIQLMRQIKKIFDPDSILNPGKIFD